MPNNWFSGISQVGCRLNDEGEEAKCLCVYVCERKTVRGIGEQESLSCLCDGVSLSMGDLTPCQSLTAYVTL